MAGKKYSDIYKTSNTNTVATTDLFITERADGNTYAFTANTLVSSISSRISSNRNIVLVNTSFFAANSETSVIVCDPAAANDDITVVFPANVEDGKVYTVKCANTLNSIVFITTSNLDAYKIEAAFGGSIDDSTSLTTTGEVYTWIAHSGVYRKI